MQVSLAKPILPAQQEQMLPTGYLTANTLQPFGTTFAFILSADHYQALPPGVVVGSLKDYRVLNSKAAAPQGYIKVALFVADDGDERCIYRKNASTS